MNARAPAVSVVITSYNYERYVGGCVRSVLAQTAPPAEVIVVDDGSTDGSLALLEGFGDRIRLVRQENRGSVAATYRGFQESAGEVLMFLDSDDLLHPRAVEEVRRAWRPGCAKVQYELELIDAEGTRLGRRYCNYVAGYDERAVREEFAAHGTYVWPVTTGNAYSRWYAAGLMPVRRPYWVDGVLNTLAPLYGDVVVVNRVLGWYRQHGGNQSAEGLHGERLWRRFQRAVEGRSRELRLLAEHAAARGRALPPGNILDRELPYVNYRLMLKRLGESYEGAERDSVASLCRAAALTLARRPLPVRLRLQHAAWFAALLCCPRPVCWQLMQLRFQRAELLRGLRRRLAPAA
jgi:glycosyltransferase involved in cell wall biosynthesis